MKTASLNMQNTPISRRNAARVYQSLSLANLTERIVRYDDRDALREFHDHRPLFLIRGKSPMLLAEFVDELCRCQWTLRFSNSNSAILDRAYDLTIDKFSNIPATSGL